MDRSVVNSFAQSYPEHPNNRSQKPEISIPPKAMTPYAPRTPIEEIPAMYTPSPTSWEKQVSGATGYTFGPQRKEFYSTTKTNPNKDSGYKKLFLVLLIAISGMLIFSSQAYSITDHIASGLGMDLFGKDGEPSILATITHTLLFTLTIYLLLIPFKDSI